MATNASKRQKISSSRCLKIINLQNNEDPAHFNDDIVKKRPLSPALDAQERIVINTDEIAELTARIYANPKNVLHQIYNSVAQKLKNPKLLLNPKYIIVTIKGNFKKWCCVYSIKWPTDTEFRKTASTKRKACYEAALDTLLWLRKNGCITKNGQPILLPISTKNEDDNVEKLELYGSPKHVLHNTFNQISLRLKNKNLQLEPIYNIVQKENSKEWSCKYCLKWPELKEIEEVASTKREASEEAALSTLLWLKNNEKITESGHPNIAIKKHRQIRLDLDDDIRNMVKTIVKEFENIVLPETEPENNCELSSTHFEDTRIKRNTKQTYLGSDKYTAKEKHELPISAYKEEIIDLITRNRVVVIKGNPGCGKSTLVPQYALETWSRIKKSRRDVFRVAVTQPRRIAAVSLAEYVASERDEECGQIVGYQIRLNSNFNQATGRILYCTTGILLRYLQSDPSIQNFPCVILDEAHEREANTDLLMNLLRKSLQLNSRLKLVIMSATIDTDLFKNYFDGAPVLNLDGFTYPVQTHFIDDIGVDLIKTKKMCRTTIPTVIHADVVKTIMYIHTKQNMGTILCFLPGWDDIFRVQALIPLRYDLLVLCLHSKLKDSDQWKIFCPSQPGVRKVILATNIAETSVTINDVVYVVDTGIHKESRFDHEQGLVCLDNQWISQANMIQRKGRAGRVQAGESFHLYTKSKFDSMSKYSEPEILKVSLVKTILDVKAFYGGGDAWEFMNKLPTPPKMESVRKSIEELESLELLKNGENLTSLGKILAHFQMHPKLAKTLVNAAIFKCVTPVIDIVAILSSEINIFNNILSDKHVLRDLKSKTGFENSDHLALMMLYEYWLELLEEHDESTAERFCCDTSLNHFNLKTITELRNIYFGYIQDGLRNSTLISDEFSDNSELVKAMLFFGMGEVLQVKNIRKNSFTTSKNDEASITSDSVNYKKTSLPSNFLVYSSAIKLTPRKTVIIRECSTVSALTILLFSSQNLTLQKIGNEETVIGVGNTNIKILCSTEDALNIQKCKMAVNSLYRYHINQLVQNAEFNSEISKMWDKILHCLNDLFLKL